MMLRFKSLVFSCFLGLSFIGVTSPSFSQISPLTTDINLLQASPFDDWQTLSTPHFKIHFQPNQLVYAQQMAQIAESVHARLSPWLQWQPKTQTEIVINDSVDFANGAATPLPYNRFYIYMNAPVDGDLMDQTGWIEQVFTHEYTHLLHHDQVSGVAENVRQVFGRGGLMSVFAFPELFAPHWSSEGIAIYAESMNGFGRNHNATYEAKMRQEVLAGLRSYSAESYEGYYNSRWPFGQVYLYGAYFYQFIEDIYGKEKVMEYITNYNANIIPWRMDKRAKQTFGIPAKALWAKFQNYLKSRFEPQILALKSSQTPVTVRVSEPYFNQFLTAGPDGSVIFYHNDAISQPEIRQVSPSGQQTTLLALDGVVGLAWHSEQGLLIQRREICDNTRLVTDLYLLSNTSTIAKRLTTCARLPRATWLPNGQGVIAVQIADGRSTLLQLDLTSLQQGQFHPLSLASFSQDEALGDLSVAPDSQSLVASVKRATTGWQLEKLTLTSGIWQPLTQNQQMARKPQFSANGLMVYYIGDHANQFQVELYRLNLSQQTTQQLTQSMGYVVDYSLVTPPKLSKLSGTQDIWLSRYHRQGQEIVWLDATSPTQVTAPLETNLPNLSNVLTQQNSDPLVLATPQPYQAWKTLKPVGWSPFWTVSNDYGALGVLVNGQDVLGFHRWSLMPTMTFIDQQTRLGGAALYDFYNRFQISATQTIVPRFNADTKRLAAYDETTRWQALAHYPKNWTDATLEFGLGVAQEQTQYHFVGFFQTFKRQDQLVGATLHWNTLHAYPHGISVTDGYQFNLTLESYDVLGQSDHQGQAMIAELAGYFDLGRGWTLKAAGLLGHGGEGIRPFQLGGQVDSLSALGNFTQLGKRDFYLRGYAASKALSGQKMVRGSVELRFPITTLYDGGSVFPLGLGRLYGKVLSDVGQVGAQTFSSVPYVGVGAEVTAELLIGFDTLKLPLTLGVAKGLDPKLGDNQLYLQLSLPL